MNAKDIHRMYRKQEDAAAHPHMRQWRQLIKGLGKRGARFVEIRPGSRQPTRKAWNQTANTLTTEQALAHLANGDNIGLAGGTGNLYVIDFDRNADRGHESDHLSGGVHTYRPNAPDRAKFFIYCSSPLPTRHDKEHGIDLIGLNANATHAQATIAGIHNSGAPILWGGHTIPVLSADTADALWQEWTGRSLFAPLRDERQTDTTYANTDLALIADAFKYADPNDTEMGYTSWIGIIAAVRDAFDGSAEALDLVVEWADGKPGEVEAKWQSFEREYTGRPATLKSLFYFARRGGWIDPTPEVAPVPLPEDAIVKDNGHVILKTTPTPETPKRPAPPVLTPTVVEKLGQALRSPTATKILARLPHARNREMYRDALIQLVTVIAPAQGGWVFDADQRWLGEKLGKSGMSAGRNMKALDNAGLIRYLHTGKVDEAKVGRPLMRVDLQPLIVDLWESCVNVTNYSTSIDPEFVTFRNDPPVNVYATYSGAGKFADASMRTPYKYAVARTGRPTVLVRSLTASGLTALDYLSRHGDATRAELVEEAGMSPGAAAGGTRCLEQLGLVSVEWDRPGPKVYVLRPDWESHLRYLIPHMASYGAHTRLVIRGFDERIEYDEWKLRQKMPPAMADDVREHKRKLENARKKWRIYGNRIGAYGRFVEANPPW